jgi:hypothetical protein
MSTTVTQTIAEYFVLLLDTLKRRWKVVALVMLCIIPGAILAAKLTPVRYTSKSLILLSADSNNVTPESQQQFMEQVAAIEAWVKSDHIMRELLPQIMDGGDITDPEALSVLLNIGRASIHFQLLGGSALEISLDGREPEGLGKKLEIILARIMEGLSGPNRGILSASQFALLKRQESVQAERLELERVIQRAGGNSPDVIEGRLRALQDLNTAIRLNQSPDGRANSGSEVNELTQRKQEMEALISSDPALRANILKRYESYQQALADYESLQAELAPEGKNYFGVLDASGVVVVGRPQDPVFGNSPGKKIAIAIVFLGLVAAGALVAAMEFFFSGVRLKAGFEDLSGLPVVSRFHSNSPKEDDHKEGIWPKINQFWKYIISGISNDFNYKQYLRSISRINIWKYANK